MSGFRNSSHFIFFFWFYVNFKNWICKSYLSISLLTLVFKLKHFLISFWHLFYLIKIITIFYTITPNSMPINLSLVNILFLFLILFIFNICLLTDSIFRFCTFWYRKFLLWWFGWWPVIILLITIESKI